MKDVVIEENVSKSMYLHVKRVMDLVLALILAVFLSPIYLILAIIIKLDGGPVFFKQERSGKDGQIFRLYKFRSMVPNNNFSDKTKGDQVTKIGKFIRKTSLDELGQIINILKGEMSFIGPRPWVLEYAKYFTEDQKRRLDVLPGVTGLAQCSGRNSMPIKEKIKYDVEYVENISFKMDLKVIFKTVKSVVKSEGVQEEGTKESFHNEIDELRMQARG